MLFYTSSGFKGALNAHILVFVFYVFILGSTDLPNMVMPGAQLFV